MMQSAYKTFLLVLLNLLATNALDIEVWSPAAVLVGHPSVDIGCEYLNPTGVRITSAELQKEWPRGSGTFQTIAIFYPPGGAEPSFSSSDAATQIKNRATLTKPTNESTKALLTIKNIVCEDHGRYKCSVLYDSTAGSGSIDKTVILKTKARGQAPYAAPVVSISGGIPENDVAYFTCKANVGKPVGKIRWWLYRPNKSNPQELTTAIETPESPQSPGTCENNVVSTLPFHANKDDNNSTVRCSVDQELLISPTGKPQDKEYKETQPITVFYKVRKPEVSKNPDLDVYNVNTPLLSIKCSTIGNPNPFKTTDDQKAKVTWYYRESSESYKILAVRIPNVQITKRELRLRDLKENQTGIYICEVQNSFKGDVHTERTELTINIVDPNKKSPDSSGQGSITNISDGAVSMMGDSVIIILLLAVIFLIYRQGRRSVKKSNDEKFFVTEMRESAFEGNLYVEATEISNKENEAKDKKYTL